LHVLIFGVESKRMLKTELNKRILDGSAAVASSSAAPMDAAAGNWVKPAKSDFWQIVHQGLRGQYKRAALLATAGASLGAGIGVELGQRVYSSTGLVRIASVLPEVMHETDQNRPMAMFDGFILAQRDVMLSRELIQAAMEEETWRRAEQTGRAPTEVQFALMLKVESRARSDHLKVTFTDKDPATAAAAVQSVIAAYQRTYVSVHDRAEAQRMDELKARHDGLSSQLLKLQTEGGANSVGQTSAELDLALNAAAECEKKVQADLVDIQCATAGMETPQEQSASVEKTPQEIVAEQLLRSATEAQAKAQSEKDNALRSGLGNDSPLLEKLNAALAESSAKLQQQIRECEQLRNSRKAAPSATSLKDREDRLLQLAESTEKEMSSLSTRKAMLLAREQKAAKIESDLKETDARLDALATEASLGSRFSVISNGDIPLTPSLDNRAKAAGAGCCLGFAITLGLVVLRSRVHRRYRFGDELAEDLKQRVPFVALLPEAGIDKPLNAAASSGIHELRGQLRLNTSADTCTYLVTSVTPGEGATSVALSLAISYAATGLRTILVDFNLASRTLTSGFDALPNVGLLEALAGDAPSTHDIRAGLFFLAAGRGASKVSFELVPSEMRRVLTELRELFDVILIDAEPIVTGTTASAIAPQVDGVLLVTSKGQEQSLIESAVARVHSLEGNIAGVVFNRADDGEFPLVMRQQSTEASLRNLPPRSMRFGALVGSVLSSLSLSHANDLDMIPAEAQQAILRAA
jgi:succinoglycan biosynthesis transport protein ExoP